MEKGNRQNGCPVPEPSVHGGEEGIPAGTRLLAAPAHPLCFESILEGLYGPGLRRDLSLFDDCEPEELVDWCIDDRCSLCNLRKDAIIDCPISVDSAESTPTEELLSQGQFNTENIECQAENYLNALFQKKDLPQNCDPNIPLAAQELLKKMIRQFAIEYISKSRKILQGNHEAVTDSAINGIQPNQTQDSFQEQDGPLDLTVTRLEENHIQDEDGVLDLSLKRNCNGYETNGKINSKNGVIRICMLKKLTKSIRRRKRNSTALTEVLHSLCLYHKQQIRLMLQFLTAERRLCSNVCRKTKESVTFQAATRDRFTTRDRLKRPASSPHLPPVSVCLEDLRLTCPNLTFGSIRLDSKKCGFEQLKSSNLVTINSKGKRHSCFVAANGTDAQPPKKRKRRTRLSSSLSDHDSRCSQDATIEQHKDSKNNVAFSSISNNSEKNGLLDIKDSLLQDFLSFVNQKVNGKIPVAQPKSHTRNLRSTEKQSIDRVKFRKLVKCILNKTVQNGCSFKEALNRYVKNLEGDSMQTRFRKRKKTMPEFESPPSSLTRREVLQIKGELCSLMESLAKETKEAAKKSTRKPCTNKKVISNKEQVHDVLVMANCGNVHREDSFQKDVTELPQNNLKVDSTSVNCSKEIGLPKHLALAPKQKVTCAERSPRCHIGPKNPKDCTTSKYSYSDKSGKYKNGCRLQGDCFAQGASNCFCKCTSRQISKIFKGKVYGFPDLLKNISRKPHLKVIVERLKDSVFSANQQFSQPAPHNGKLNTYDLKRKRNPTVSHCCNASQSLGKPLNHVRKGTHLSVNRRNDNIGVPCGDRVPGAKRNQSTKVSTEQSMPSIPNRLCSPVKIMFLSNVDGAEGIKYSLSSVYVSGHEKSSEKPAESRIDRQDTCTTVLSEKSIDKRGTAPESKTSSHGWKESRTSEDACDKADFYEKRPRRMPNRVAPLVLKQIRNPIGASPKIQIKQNAECEEPKRNFTVCKRNVDNEHSGITLSIKFGSSTMRRCISRVNAPHFKGILCKKAQLPPSKINILPIGKRNSDKTRDPPNSAGKASICNFENRRTTRSNSARLQNPQELSMCKKSVTFKCHKTPEKSLPLSNTLPCFLQKRIDPEQAVEWKANKTTDQQSQRKPFNTRSLRSSVSRNCKLSSQATLSTSLNPMPSTLNAFRRNSKRCSLNKHKLINERCENMDEVCEPPSGNAEGLKSVINVLDSSASSIFQPNNVLKWWSSSSSKESLLQDLNHRYEQITNTWQKETDNEKSSSLQLSAANRRSFVQMMFDKKYDDKDISVWLMQTTETKSLSILPKANARQPSEENHHLGVKTRKKRTKKSKRRVRRLHKLRCRRVWNLNHIESPEDQSKDICLKFVCTRKILGVTFPEKCTLRKDFFESPTSSPPDSQAVAKGSALNCSNATTRVPRKKTGKLLDNEPMTTQTRCYANKPTINVKGCKAFISKPGGVEGKAPKENGSFLKPLHPRNSTEQNKCTLRSNHNFTVDFRTKRNKGRHWSLTKTLSTTLNSKNSELGKRSGLRKSRRTAITNPSVTWILERKMKRKRHGMVVSTCGEISPKKSKVPLTTRKEDVEYSKMKLGPLKPIGLPSPRGLSNKGGMYSLAPIRISHHGTNTKA